MKNLLIMVLSVVLMNSAYAYDTAKLHVRITDTVVNAKAYFVCFPGSVGCVSIQAANQGKDFPIDTGKVNSIFAANFSNMQMYTQALPPSCNVSVNKDQTLTVTGKLVIKKAPNKQTSSTAYISDLHCSVV